MNAARWAKIAAACAGGLLISYTIRVAPAPIATLCAAFVAFVFMAAEYAAQELDGLRKYRDEQRARKQAGMEER